MVYQIFSQKNGQPYKHEVKPLVVVPALVSRRLLVEWNRLGHSLMHGFRSPKNVNRLGS
jgi:hypothetical protein